MIEIFDQHMIAIACFGTFRDQTVFLHQLLTVVS